MEFFVVFRHYVRKPVSRGIRSLTKLESVKEASWHWEGKDNDNDAVDGFVHVFRREDAARRYFANCRISGGESIYLVYVRAWTMKGAAKKATQTFVDEHRTSCEIIESFHPDKGAGAK